MVGSDLASLERCKNIFVREGELISVYIQGELFGWKYALPWTSVCTKAFVLHAILFFFLEKIIIISSQIKSICNWQEICKGKSVVVVIHCSILTLEYCIQREMLVYYERALLSDGGYHISSCLSAYVSIEVAICHVMSYLFFRERSRCKFWGLCIWWTVE